VSATASTLLRLRDVSVGFGAGAAATTVLSGINLEVERGQFITIVGASGSGKTTLLRAIDGLIPCLSGEVALDGRAVRGPGKERAFVFQADCLLPWRTVLDNVAFSLEVQGTVRQQARETALTYLELTGLRDAAAKFPGELSGGMRQRVNLARALAVDPEILLMDEPFAALDAQTREVMQIELLTIWQKRRKTVLFVTHQLDEAVYLGDRVVVLSAIPGRIRAVVEVDLPRPRPLELKHTPDFNARVDKVWGLIRDDVMRERRV